MNVQMPTFMAFKNGQKISEVVGAIPDKLNVRVPLLFSSAPAYDAVPQEMIHQASSS
jgi:hypothetical protein